MQYTNGRDFDFEGMAPWECLTLIYFLRSIVCFPKMPSAFSDSVRVERSVIGRNKEQCEYIGERQTPFFLFYSSSYIYFVGDKAVPLSCEGAIPSIKTLMNSITFDHSLA